MQSNPQLSGPPAVIIGLDCITGLQTARILSSYSIPVIGLAADTRHYCCNTNACSRIFRSDLSGEGLVQTLCDLGKTLNPKAVLFPCTDQSVLEVSRNRDALHDFWGIDLPDQEILEMLVDKVQFTRFAREKQLPVPKTWFVRSREQMEKVSLETHYPCILKPPVRTDLWERKAKCKVFRVDCQQNLMDLYDRCSGWAPELMIQEWIHGPDSELYSCNAYFDAKSKPLATFIAKKIRQWPPRTGTSCLGVECRNDSVLREAVRLFQSVNFQGLGYLEMKKDSRSGKYLIIEANIGRPTGRSAIAEAGGVELLHTRYCHILGRSLPKNRQQKYDGVKWVYLRRDLQSALHYWRRGELTWQQWLRSLQGRKTYAVASLRDPIPFLTDFLGAASRLLTGTGSRRQIWHSRLLEPPRGISDPLSPIPGNKMDGQ